MVSQEISTKHLLQNEHQFYTICSSKLRRRENLPIDFMTSVYLISKHRIVQGEQSITKQKYSSKKRGWGNNYKPISLINSNVKFFYKILAD